MPMMDERSRLLELATTLKIQLKGGLVRDPVGRPAERTGDWRLEGRWGHIYPDGDGYLLVLHFPGHPRRWTHAKRVLGQYRVTQDGDDEGCIQLRGGDYPELIRSLMGARFQRPPSQADRLAAHRYG